MFEEMDDEIHFFKEENDEKSGDHMSSGSQLELTFECRDVADRELNDFNLQSRDTSNDSNDNNQCKDYSKRLDDIYDFISKDITNLEEMYDYLKDTSEVTHFEGVVEPNESPLQEVEAEIEPQEVVIEVESHLISINENKRKRGRKSLVESGLTHSQICERRREQNKNSQKRVRDRKKAKKCLVDIPNSSYYIITESQLTQFVKALEVANDQIQSGHTSQAISNINFVINNLNNCQLVYKS